MKKTCNNCLNNPNTYIKCEDYLCHPMCQYLYVCLFGNMMKWKPIILKAKSNEKTTGK